VYLEATIQFADTSEIKRKEYQTKKNALVQEFKDNLSKQGSFALNKDTSNLFRNRKIGPSKKLDVKQLNRVISIDPKALEAEVEAMITYEDLVNETLKFNCLPAVVPQLKTITVGGALSGLGIESTSFRYGLVHETIFEIEILTGEGKALILRPDNEHKDLFYAFPNSYGTLGYALKIKLKLIPAKKFIRLTHFHMHDPTLFFEKIRDLCKERRTLAYDSYIDGVIFDENEMVITLGEFTNEAPKTSDYTYMEVYYQSIRKKKTDFLTTYDYIWRWDSDWFWCSKHFGMNHWILRLLFGKFMLHSKVYWKIKHLFATNRFLNWILRRFEKPSESVIQDILIPVENAAAFYDFMRRSIQIAPIWICPSISDARYSLCPLDPKVLYLDFGFWDILPSNKPNGYYNRLIEKKTQELNGFKGLYSDSFFSEEEFWKIYPKAAFSDLKKKYDPENVFKGLYDKCVRRM
jgi:FAD/FMN-containing dehydrogenase